jgi:protein involved in polysaccharide export with SLBB domain
MIIKIEAKTMRRIFATAFALVLTGNAVIVGAQSNPLAFGALPTQPKLSVQGNSAISPYRTPTPIDTYGSPTGSKIPDSAKSNSMMFDASGASTPQGTSDNSWGSGQQAGQRLPLSDVFGANLFTGAFARQGPVQFNPDYTVASGDSIQVRLWGAFTFDANLVVDPKGNIFLPLVGPIQLRGIRNQDIQRVVDAAVGGIFKSSVFSYASLAAAQPVRVFVSGFVARPGLYAGTSMDSVLHYLDQAGGIDTDRGSFLTVQVKRGAQLRAKINLYDFLLSGVAPSVQLADGDVILIGPRQSTLKVSGLAENPKRFEFETQEKMLRDVTAMAKPLPQVTHARVTRNTGAVKNVEYFALVDAPNVALFNGDEVEFTADKKPGTITVRVEGEHQSPQEYVLPYGARMGELLRKIELTERSDRQSFQLFRLSVKERQKQALATSLQSLETAALTARSGTSDEARLRADEATLILKWVERAKAIEPRGQVLIAESTERDGLLLENGDVIRVPVRDGLVLVNGEVLFPNAITHDQRLGLDDYIKRAGGYTQTADSARVLIARRDGSFVEVNEESGFFKSNRNAPAVKAGDEILVLPKIEVKSRQIWKDMTQIIYQIAISTRVVIGLL